MRICTETYVVYKYDEMDEDMKEKVLEKHADININHDWWDGDYHLGLTMAEMQSRKIPLSDRWWESDKPKDHRGNILGEYPAHTGLFCWDDLSFSLDDSYIHFDHLWVTNEDVFRRYLRVPKALWETCDWDFYVEQGRYGNTRLMIEPDYNYREVFTEKQQAIIDRAMGIMNDHIDEALVNLQKDFDQRQTRTAIEETLRANEYEFTEDGNIA